MRFAHDRVIVDGEAVPFEEVVAKAYLARVQLWSDGFYATPKLYWDQATLQGRPFYYYSYGAAVSEVVIDTLTGEMRSAARRRAARRRRFAESRARHRPGGRRVHAGHGLAHDRGTVVERGRQADDARAVDLQDSDRATIRPDFRVRLFKNRNVEDSIHRSKAVGEPPLLLPFSVFFAIRDAVSAVGDHKVNPPLNAPATSEAILDAVAFVENAVRRTRQPDMDAWQIPTDATGRADHGRAGRRFRAARTRRPHAGRCSRAVGHRRRRPPRAARRRDRARHAGKRRGAPAGALPARPEPRPVLRRRRAPRVRAGRPRPLRAAGGAPATTTAGASSRWTVNRTAPSSTRWATTSCAGRALSRFRAQRRHPRAAGRRGRRWLVDHVPAPRAHVMLFGAGHVGAAIVRLLADLPCRVTWVDEREDMFPPWLPGQRRRGSTDMPEALAREAARRHQLPRHDAQSRAGPAPDRSDPQAAARTGLVRPDRLGHQTQAVRAPPARPRHLPRAPGRHGVPDRRARHQGQGARRDRRRRRRATADGLGGGGQAGAPATATPASLEQD